MFENAEAFKRHFLTLQASGSVPACRYCGLVAANGCHHLIANFTVEPATMRVRRASDVDVSRRVTIPVNGAGVPLAIW